MTQSQYAVQMKSITKKFPGVVANYKIDFNVTQGEVHGLLGENGAGKTTLMRILSGLYQPDEGEIVIKGRKVKFNSPRDAIRAGVGMVHQTFSLVPLFSVAENVALGLKPSLTLIDIKSIRKEVNELSKKYGLEVDPDAIVEKLPVGIQQKVEILKLLYRNADILILDEPTSVLTVEEIPRLVETMRQFAAIGKTVIFITHKLKEVMIACDVVTVLRKGEKVATLKPTSTAELANLMMGEEKLEINTESRAPIKTRPSILELRNVCAKSEGKRFLLTNVSIHLRSGEILGIAGVEGNGQAELVECIIGQRQISSGELFLYDSKVTKSNIRDLYRRKVSYIPFNKHETGVAQDLTLVENVLLREISINQFIKDRFGLLVDYSKAQKYSQSIVEKFGVVTRGLNVPTRTLSGGNISKLVIGRELSRRSELIIVTNPTAGLDVKTTNFTRNELLKKKREGAAILLISTDLDEILELSDRVVVIYQGEIMGELSREKLDIRTIGMMMGGVRLEEIKTKNQ